MNHKILAPILKRAFGMPEEVAKQIFDNPAEAIFALFDKEIDSDIDLQEGEEQIVSLLLRVDGRPKVLVVAINEDLEIIRQIKFYDLGHSIKPEKK